MRIAVVSLGCPKNQVDADVFCRALIEAGHVTVPRTDMADVVIVNTCGFIDSAKQEAIECILDACALKNERPELRVVVTGCLAERYRDEVATEIPEVDAVVGIGKNSQMCAIIEGLDGRADAPLQCYGPKSALDIDARRVISTPPHYAWLKIAEGCSNACAYCAIPGIRGPMRSRSIESVVAEAEWLAGQGVRELVLVAQDVTAYGNDKGESWLPQLLHQLNALDGVRWIRLLYAYPERIDEALLSAMLQCEKVLHYLDLPIQHCDETVLAAMGRRGGAAAVQHAVRLIRATVPDMTLRTSLITGYPGETEAQFEALCEFVQKTRIDRLGCFAYSAEEGTRAAQLPGQLPEEEKQRRAEIIMELQAGIMAEKQEALVGASLVAVCDGYDEDMDCWLCRGAADAPEIDANVLVDGEAPMREGEFYQLEITGVEGLDLNARLIGPAGWNG